MLRPACFACGSVFAILLVIGTAVPSSRKVILRSPGPIWTLGPRMRLARAHHAAVLLPSGQVLVVGGQTGDIGSPLDGAELYDPRLRRWTRTASLPALEGNPDAVLLHDGRVMTLAGFDADANIFWVCFT